MEVLDLRLSHYEFDCLVSKDSLTQEEITYLGLTGNEEEWVAVEGDFTIGWDGEIPLVIIDSAIFVNNNKYLSLSEEFIIQLEEIIERDGNTLDWAADRLESELDNYEYDR